MYMCSEGQVTNMEAKCKEGMKSTLGCYPTTYRTWQERTTMNNTVHWLHDIFATDLWMTFISALFLYCRSSLNQINFCCKFLSLSILVAVENVLTYIM